MVDYREIRNSLIKEIEEEKPVTILFPNDDNEITIE